MFKHLIALALISNVFVDTFNFTLNDEDEQEDEDIMEDQPSSSDDDVNLVKIGDMLLTNDQYDYLYKRDPNKRVGYTSADKKWPKGIVPIKFKEGDFDESMKEKVRFAMDYIMNVSCIKFKTEFNQSEFPNFVLVKYQYGACSSQVGNRQNGPQALNLHERCGKGNIVHELLHSLGLLHMHTSPERDNFVKIIFENIRPETVRNFEKTLAPVSMYDTLYDYTSIMHYGQNSFQKGSSNVKVYTTILPKEKASEMGQRKRMSDGDITRLNRMYKCPNFERKEVEIFQESESLSDLEDETSNEANDSNSQQHNKGELVRRTSQSETSSLALNEQVKELVNVVLNYIKPLCDLEAKLKRTLI